MKKFLLIVVAVGAMMSAGCSKNDAEKGLSMKFTETTLVHGDQYGINATSLSPITYTSEDRYHATVSETGIVTAMCIGQTKMLVSDGTNTKTFKVTVKPRNTLYPEPDVKFGITRSEVVAKLGPPDVTDENGVGYISYSPAAPMVVFLFDESGKLAGYSVMVKALYTEALTKFISERYIEVSQEEDVFYFFDGLEQGRITKIVAVSVYNEAFCQVLYAPYTLTRTAPTLRDFDFERLLSKLQF